jgi:hypothetical protein
MLFTFELESLVAMALKKRNVGRTTTAVPTSRVLLREDELPVREPRRLWSTISATFS